MTITHVIQAFLKKHPAESAQEIERAYLFAKLAHRGQKRISGEPYIQHPLHTTYTLAKLGLDRDTLIASLLHDTVEDNKTITLEIIEQRFGSKIASLVDAVTKLSTRFEKVPFSAKQIQIESLRKMFLAMARDIRVVLIKLGDRLHNMKTIRALPAGKQKRIAQETLDIYAPLANRLGIFDLKWQLEDLAFATLKPKEYAWIKNEVQERRGSRERYAHKIAEILKRHIEEAGMTCAAQYRVKHFYSIYKKAVNKYDNDVSRVYDLIAVRIVVDSVEDCYAALGIIHRQWKPLVHRIKDYIAIPKFNNYQALHTTVFADQGKLTEIQIQTKSMYQESEFGVAAHWNYDENIKESTAARQAQLRWINQISNWHYKLSDSKAFFDAVRIDVFKDKIFVFTSEGNVVDLPNGATPIDLAYEIDPQRAHQTKTVKVNDRPSSFNRKLENGDIVELIESPGQRMPPYIWMRIAKTKKARDAIKECYNHAARLEKIQMGKKLIEYGLINNHKPGIDSLTKRTWQRLLSQFKQQSKENFFIALTEGKVKTSEVVRSLYHEHSGKKSAEHKFSLRIKASNRLGLLKDILALLTRLRINLSILQTSEREMGTSDFYINMVLTADDKQKIKKFTAQVSKMRNVIFVEEVEGSARSHPSHSRERIG